MKSLSLTLFFLVSLACIAVSQQVERRYFIDYNAASNVYEMKMEVLSGSATTPYERAQLFQTIALVRPSGWSHPAVIQSTYMPLYDNVDYNGNTDCQNHPNCYWRHEDYAVTSSNNGTLQYSLFTINSVATGLHYNDLATGGIVHLFDFTFGASTAYSADVRVYDPAIDPDFLEPGFNGMLLGDYVDFAVAEETVKPRIQLRVYLEGAILNHGNELGATHNRPLMRDDLRRSPFDDNRYIPTTSPYVEEVGGHSLVANGTFEQIGLGGELAFTAIPNPDSLLSITGEDAIVDWIFVELLAADNTDVVIASRSALLQRDGDIVDVDGKPGIRIPGLPMGSYYVVIRHRNHLATVTAAPIPTAELSSLVDFTDINTQTYDGGTTLADGLDFTGLGQNSTTLLGYQCMWTGDADNNGKVKFTGPGDDLNIILFDVLSYPTVDDVPIETNFDNALGYNPGDIDMNSKSKYDNPNDDANFLQLSLFFYPQNILGYASFDFFDEQLNRTQRLAADTSPEAGEIRVRLRVYLHGAVARGIYEGLEYSLSGRPLMSDALRNHIVTGQNYIPRVDPYQVEQNTHTLTTNPRFQHVGPGSNTQFLQVADSAALFSTTGEDAIVDWVFVELRSKSDYTQVVATRAGLVQRDGDVVDVDGTLGLLFSDIDFDSYYVAVKHRIHLGTMTACAYSPQILNTMVDFTDPDTDLFDFGEQVYSNPQYGNIDYSGLAQDSRTLSNHLCLHGSDNNGDGRVVFEDEINVSATDIFTFVKPDGTTNVLYNYDEVYGYYPGDSDMSGKVKGPSPDDDANIIFFNALIFPLNYGFMLKSGLFIEQIPK